MLCFSGSLFGDMPNHFAFKQSIISGQDFAQKSFHLRSAYTGGSCPLLTGGNMKKCYYCILVLTLFGYPNGSPSGLSVNLSNINVSIML